LLKLIAARQKGPPFWRSFSGLLTTKQKLARQSGQGGAKHPSLERRQTAKGVGAKNNRKIGFQSPPLCHGIVMFLSRFITRTVSQLVQAL
jgi:hypothetical protein